jgi:D-glycero-D-manno-heptose 1,7-bisphosphate phosphatase
MVDMDGTIREPLSGRQYFQHPKDQSQIEGAVSALRAYKDDWLIIGITNQGGVEAGYKSLQDCIKEQQYTLQLFPELKEIYFCPDFAGKKCFRVTRHNVHNHSKTKWSGQYRKPTCRHPILSSRRLETTASTGDLLRLATTKSSALPPLKVRFHRLSDHSD